MCTFLKNSIINNEKKNQYINKLNIYIIERSRTFALAKYSNYICILLFV